MNNLNNINLNNSNNAPNNSSNINLNTNNSNNSNNSTNSISNNLNTLSNLNNNIEGNRNSKNIKVQNMDRLPTENNLPNPNHHFHTIDQKPNQNNNHTNITMNEKKNDEDMNSKEGFRDCNMMFLLFDEFWNKTVWNRNLKSTNENIKHENKMQEVGGRSCPISSGQRLFQGQLFQQNINEIQYLEMLDIPVVKQEPQENVLR